MSELKYYKLFHRASALTSPEFLSVVEFGNGDEVYLKSEADKLIADLEESHKMEVEQLLIEIAEKDKEIARLKAIRKVHVEAIESMGAGIHQDEEEILHQKYKRCLAMAWWCSAELGMLVSTWESKIKYYKRWQKRWLELAEKFKPNKEADDGND